MAVERHLNRAVSALDAEITQHQREVARLERIREQLLAITRQFRSRHSRRYRHRKMRRPVTETDRARIRQALTHTERTAWPKKCVELARQLKLTRRQVIATAIPLKKRA